MDKEPKINHSPELQPVTAELLANRTDLNGISLWAIVRYLVDGDNSLDARINNANLICVKDDLMSILAGYHPDTQKVIFMQPDLTEEYLSRVECPDKEVAVELYRKIKSGFEIARNEASEQDRLFSKIQLKVARDVMEEMGKNSQAALIRRLETKIAEAANILKSSIALSSDHDIDKINARNVKIKELKRQDKVLMKLILMLQKKNNKESNDQNSALIEEIKALRSAVNAAHQKLRSINRAAQKERNKLRAETVKLRVSEARSRKKSQREKTETQKIKVSANSHAISSEEGETAKLEQKILKLKAQILALNVRLTTVNDEKLALISEIAQLKIEVDEANNANRRLRNKLSDAADRLKSALKAKDAEIALLRISVNDLIQRNNISEDDDEANLEDAPKLKQSKKSGPQTFEKLLDECMASPIMLKNYPEYDQRKIFSILDIITKRLIPDAQNCIRKLKAVEPDDMLAKSRTIEGNHINTIQISLTKAIIELEDQIELEIPPKNSLTQCRSTLDKAQKVLNELNITMKA